MIAALNGYVTQFGPNSIYFRVNNIEYEIMVPLNVLDYLQKIESENKLKTDKQDKPEKKENILDKKDNFVNIDKTNKKENNIETISEKKEIRLYIYHLIKEEDEKLFGFLEFSQKEFFSSLLLIRGVGPNLALSLLSHLDLSNFIFYCKTKNYENFTRIPRVGKSIAETIIFEVNKKLEKWEKLLISAEKNNNNTNVNLNLISNYDTRIKLSPQKELAIQALLQLGYKEKEVIIAITSIEKNELENSKKENIEFKELEAAELIRAVLKII